MRLPILINFLKEFRFVVHCLDLYQFLNRFLLVCICFDMRCIYENYRRIDHTMQKTLLKNLLEDLLKQICSLKSAGVVLSEGTKMRYL